MTDQTGREPVGARAGRAGSGAILQVGPQPAGQIALVDLLDRLLGTGVVLAGDIVISLSGVDLVQVRLQALVSSVRDQLPEPD
ncbi:MAG TPA: gas vesicle protein [Flexivirga sp.]|uniref:gas vesicle protein n=1 Tax=Flexivirga sp. TaxID=1962927 RepID=UPI002D00F5A9|nr:gas vesicle protein [Flexivirga sp.]HWC21738.1 gas vesicle protein [Flexivirga sp.]